MTIPPVLQKKIGRPLLASGALCLALLLSACGNDDDNDTSPPPGDGGGGTPPATCTSAHCAPAP
ncbi:Uncharacterised protein [Bordetella ansorpii]|uniref:Lipoprotein n=1 Tax=Bordetella ansorpii TaxID=288768 RepID=A0A157RHK9_9BORD|nr:hypothetical protein [Bordetella ansorpii]SAI56899.1 Uncharacterised protein [Bordetella ansorpii]